MRRFRLLVAVGVLALSGCAVGQDGSDPISVQVGGVQSKAVVLTATTPATAPSRLAVRAAVPAAPPPRQAVAANCASKDPVSIESGHAGIGERAPGFVAIDFNCRPLALSSFKGRAVLVNFWASWCDHCKEEMAAMESAYRSFYDAGFDIVAADTDESGDGPGFYKRNGLTFAAVFDPGRPGKIARAYGIQNALPYSVFIRRDGTIDDIHIGSMDSAYIRAEVRRCLG